MVCVDNNNDCYLIYDKENLVKENNEEDNKSSAQAKKSINLSYKLLTDKNNKKYRCYLQEYDDVYKIIIENDERNETDEGNKYLIYSEEIAEEFFNNENFGKALFHINDTQCFMFDQDNNFAIKTTEPKDLISNTSKHDFKYMWIGGLGFTAICLAIMYKQYCIDQQIYLSGIA